ncbi:MAG: NAD(P)-dependent oxidoreductase, partial [Clostridia bacterium]|nr:NAD(P)-dependent oxidoreductase [Clostridia bacterium]
GLLLTSRNIVGAYKWAQSLKCEEGIAAKVEKGKSNFAGPEIMGKTLGVVGLGAIGVLVANAAVALGMKVIGYDPYFSLKNALALDSSVKFTQNIDDIYAVSDYITVHVPATNETTNMINNDSLAKCKDGVRILNFARNELVDAEAIKAGLESGKVSYYATDFPNENTVGVEGIITLPHLGASTPEAEDNCAAMAAEEMMEYLEKGNIVNSVNYPCVSAPQVAGCERVCVLSKAEAMDAVKNAIKGAEQLTAKTRGNYGYTIADVKSADTAEVEAVEGVLGVRVIK